MNNGFADFWSDDRINVDNIKLTVMKEMTRIPPNVSHESIRLMDTLSYLFKHTSKYTTENDTFFLNS